MKNQNTPGSGSPLVELFTHPRLWKARQRVVALCAVPLLIIAATFAAVGAGSPPSFQSIALASDPLYATTSGDKPTLALALSVEFPTVGAQYVRQPGDSTDDTYSNDTEYLGYYDAESCYTYNNAPTETPATGFTATDYKRFDRSGAATSRKCANAFSGNFLNWSSNSAIDMLRLALSGGDRYIDTPDVTILQRAVIPNGNPICMWNSSNFPAKQLARAGGTSGSPFFGAVPQAMATAAGSNDIWVGNTLNRIYFGTSRGGSCGNTGSYALGGSPPGPAIGPITNYSGTPPATVSTTACASEGGTCTLSGTQEIWYGANGRWKVAPATGTVSCTNGVFGDPISGTFKGCYLGSYSGPWTSPNSGAGLNTDGFFYSRVRVCDQTGTVLNDARDYPFCEKQGSGFFKPNGVIQKYSDQLRLSAFGYLMDPTASYNGGRFGGVLRAPMKYVGSKTFDINGQENTPGTGNPEAEWDPTTGVFKVNPSGAALTGTNATFGNSGVVNYLNKFGRTGPIAGRYKTYDPVSELYYETLRYMQGLQPSADAVSGINNDMYDGFPVYTNWVDPFGNGRTNTGKYACLKNNIVVIGDVNTHDGNRWPAANAAGNIPNLGYWNGVVGSFERNNTTSYVDGQGATQTTGNPNPANNNPRLDGIVGYSYWAHTQDIRGTAWTDQPALQRPGLRVKTFVFDVNEYGDQTNNYTRRNRNQFFTAAKYGGFESDPSNAGSKPYNSFGNPFKRQDGTNDNTVWEDPARPGEAGAYYLQSSARGVLSAFDSIFSRASTSARSIAGSAIQSRSLQTSSAIYQGAFDTSNWSGDLFAVPVTVNAGNNVSLGSTNNWSASDRLGSLSTPDTTRNIVIGNPGGAAAPVAFNFEYNAMPTVLKNDLDKPSPTAASDGLGSLRVAYLRGNRSKDGNGFRQRNNKLLGDIINSGVAYSGAPSTSITSSTYAGFVTANASRPPAVFVGANDGMLHGFNADTGDELFGFIPSWLSPKLSALTSPTYIVDHQSYVDAPPVVAEAQVGATNTSADWKTVLVSGTGAGGRGVFALDVTRPESFSTASAMWEFTQNDDADMGFVLGQPQIAKMRTSAPGATATYKWYAIVASGVNSYLPDAAGVFSSGGNPSLFILDLAKQSGAAWQLGTNYFKVSFPVDTVLAATKAPGVINFKTVLGAAREVTYLFAGDLHGKMWKLDFRAKGSANWNMANLTGFTNGSGNPYPLYIAKDSGGNVQPITMAPSLVSSESPSGVYVAFGTGKYLEASDRTSSSQNSFYVIYDNSTQTADGGAPNVSVISGRGRLAAGTINNGSGNITFPSFVWGRASSDADATQRSGWYIDYAVAGERQISGATLSGDELILGSLIPGVTGSANTCGVTGGSGNEYRLNIDTGIGRLRTSTVGIMGQPLITELVEATSYTKTDSTGRRVKTTVNQVFNQGSGGIATSDKQETKSYAGRLSWRQINNYLDLKQP